VPREGQKERREQRARGGAEEKDRAACHAKGSVTQQAVMHWWLRVGGAAPMDTPLNACASL